MENVRSALVTGASSGIGSAVVGELCRAGIRTYAVARRREALERLQAQTGCVPTPLDLLDVDEICKTVASLEPDILVNAAGNALGLGGLLTTEANEITESVRVNVEAPFQVLRAILPSMLEKHEGDVINIGSTAGIHPIHSALYGAVKGAMHRLSENLRIELAGTGIRVSEICPGRTATELFATALGEQASEETLGALRCPLMPADIAKAVMYVLDQPRYVNITTLEVVPTEEIIGGLRFIPMFDE